MMQPEDRPRNLIAKLARSQMQGSQLPPATQAVLMYSLMAHYINGTSVENETMNTSLVRREKRGIFSHKNFTNS